MLRVLFVVPRMHPNLRGIHSAIVAAGGTCKFLVNEIGPSEPEHFEDRIEVSNLQDRGVPLRQLLSDYKANLILQRDFRGLLRDFWSDSSHLGIRTLVYDQLPISMSFCDVVLRPRRFFSFFFRLLKRKVSLGPYGRVSPVAPWNNCTYLFSDKASHFRFPMALRVKSPGVERQSGQQVVCVAKHGQSRKRVRWLLKALERSKSDLNLVLIGSSPRNARDRLKHRRTLRAISRMEHMADRVTVHYDVAEKTIHELLGEATLFVLPSRSEPFAISPLEAMAHQVPALISSDSGSVEYVREVSDLLIFKSWSFSDFQKKLILILREHKLRAELSEKTRITITKNHDPNAFVSWLETLRDRGLDPALSLEWRQSFDSANTRKTDNAG